MLEKQCLLLLAGIPTITTNDTTYILQWWSCILLQCSAILHMQYTAVPQMPGMHGSIKAWQTATGTRGTHMDVHTNALTTWCNRICKGKRGIGYTLVRPGQQAACCHTHHKLHTVRQSYTDEITGLHNCVIHSRPPTQSARTVCNHTQIQHTH